MKPFLHWKGYMSATMGEITAPFRSWGGFQTALLRGIFKPRCPVCYVWTSSAHTLCPSCWEGFHFITPTLCCRFCALPFPYEPLRGGASVCLACLKDPPAFDGFRTCGVYEENMRKLIVLYKHYDQLSLTPLFVNWLQGVLKDWEKEGLDMVTCVPLHPRRFARRWYNQAAALAQGLGQKTGLEVETSLLVRKRFEHTQKGLSRQARFRNVAGAFELSPHGKEKIQGKTIVLLDDVCTTGATLEACSAVLKKAGAKKVYALTVARVFPDLAEHPVLSEAQSPPN